MESKRKTVLIIDDDESITNTFARILGKKGYFTDAAQSGKEALAKAEAKFYDVALIDICLPDMNGNELLDKLKKYEKMVKIIITGVPMMAPQNKADAYLVKPVRPQELIELIEWKTAEKNDK